MDNRTFKNREDIPLKDRWATEDLYASDELWEQELRRMTELGKVMAGYAGTLGRDAKTLLSYMQRLEDIQVLSAQLSNYAQRKGDEDTRVAAYQAMVCLKFEFSPVEKQTTPPKHYTTETLNNYLKNPFREEKAKASEEEGDDTQDYKAMFEGLELGTEATRTGIIENVIKSGYIRLKKDVYSILPDGKYLIRQLTLMGISMDKYKTAETGKALKQVFRGEKKIPDAIAIAKEEIERVFGGMEDESLDTGFFRDEVGICPLCGKSVVKGKYSYGCEDWREGCSFRINLAICSRAIGISQVKKLLSEGKTDLLQNFISPRTGNAFSARLVLGEGGKVNFEF